MPAIRVWKLRNPRPAHFSSSRFFKNVKSASRSAPAGAQKIRQKRARFRDSASGTLIHHSLSQIRSRALAATSSTICNTRWFRIFRRLFKTSCCFQCTSRSAKELIEKWSKNNSTRAVISTRIILITTSSFISRKSINAICSINYLILKFNLLNFTKLECRKSRKSGQNITMLQAQRKPILATMKISRSLVSFSKVRKKNNLFKKINLKFHRRSCLFWQKILFPARFWKTIECRWHLREWALEVLRRDLDEMATERYCI